MSLDERFNRDKKEREEHGSTIDLQTLIVPYLDPEEDGNPETAALKWAILGTYALKDHERIRSLLEDYEQDIGTIESEKLQELIAVAYKDYDTKIHLISWSNKDGALADLATWNDDIETQEEAYDWLNDNGYDTSQYETPWLNKKAPPEEPTAEEDPSPSSDISKEETPKSKKTTKKLADWDDEHWEGKSDVLLLRSALVQKYEQMQGFKVSAMEEINSDVPTGIYAAASATPLMEFSPAASLITAFGLGIGGAIFYDKTTVEHEFHDILKVLSNHQKNRGDPEKRDQALDLLKQEKDKLGIKLANVKPVDKDTFNEHYKTFLGIAYDKGYLIRPNTTSAVIDEATQSLHKTSQKRAKEVTDNLGKTVKAGTALAWTALKTSVKRWKDPIALASGTINGFKAIGINAADTFKIAQRKQSIKQSDQTLKKLDSEMQFHWQSDKKMPTVKTMHTKKTLETLEEAQKLHDAQIDRHDNIDSYRSRQPFNLGVFSMASGLTGVGVFDLIVRTRDLCTYYAADPSVNAAAQEMMQNAVTDNWLGVLTNSWGVLMGGIAALGATGQKYYDDTKALRSTFAQVDNSLETLVEYQHSLRRLAEDQSRKAELEEQVKNAKLRFGHDSAHDYKNPNPMNSPHQEGTPPPPQSDHSNE